MIKILINSKYNNINTKYSINKYINIYIYIYIMTKDKCSINNIIF
jgi:hypothetical protein